MTSTARNERRILGGAVRRIREAKGIKLDQLATLAEVHFAYLSNIERGKKPPSVEVMCRIANGLGVDLDDISYMATIYVINEDAA
jgi:XRE family transcriptional regulator, regulator of sulfur utilization